MKFMKWIGFFIIAAMLVACAPKAVTTVPNSDAPAKESAGQYKDKRDSTSAAKGRSAQKIMEVVKANTPNRLKPLYNNFLRTKPGFGGKITVKFKILPDGNVETGEIVGTTMNFPEFEKAVLDDILQWKFDAGDYSNCTVTIPFTFSE
ncbi:TonB family protein [Fibrobacter sp. UBA4297]|uniref:TonB family protein n=1 Tax=Fibrobacter sp. UBA4297 TaxID=1946536 RepID=UPI0025BA1477|nr:TonB family protein [Fibrobacter sp. UBA4297]